MYDAIHVFLKLSGLPSVNTITFVWAFFRPKANSALAVSKASEVRVLPCGQTRPVIKLSTFFKSGEVRDRLDVTDFFAIHLLRIPGEALVNATPCPWTAVQDNGHLSLASRESCDKSLRCLDLSIPALLAKTSAAINEQNDVLSPVASQSRCSHCELTPVHIAGLILQTIWGPSTCTLASSFSILENELLPLPGTTIAVLAA
jgi:hypothetical protein